jgi:hypothetical protein
VITEEEKRCLPCGWARKEGEKRRRWYLEAVGEEEALFL